MRTRHGRRFTLGIRPVLALLALLPMLGVTFIALDQVTEARSDADVAAQITAASERLDALTAFDSDLATEGYWTTARASVSSLGVTPELVAQIVDIDIDARLSEARSSTDGSLTDVEADEIPDLLQQVRAVADDGDMSGVQIDTIYLELKQTVDRLVDLEISQVNALVATVPKSERTAGAVADLESAVRLRELVSRMTSGYFATRYPSQTSTGSGVDLLLGAVYAYDQAVAGFESTLAAGEPAAVVWGDVKSDAQVTAFLDRVEVTRQALLDPAAAEVPAFPVALGAIDLDEEAAAFLDALASIEHYVALVASTSEELSKGATELEATAATQATSVMLRSVLLGLATIVAVVLASRWILRPLRRLARGVSSMREGRPVGDLRATGPRELQATTEALNEAVGHLHLAEQQAAALAAEDLDNPVLAEEAPGELGASLQAAVTKLAGSLSEREEIRQRLAHESVHDGLTGLPNRTALSTALTRALARVRRAQTDLAVLIVDVDAFKAVNDSCGHAGGDRVLRTLANRLVTSTRDGDQVARLGADEFAVIAEPVRDAAEAVALARRIQQAISEPVDVDGESVGLSVSIGIGLAGGHELEADEILRDADLAVWRAKELGGGCVEVCDVALRTTLARRADVETALREAIEADQLEVHYQPVVTAAEAHLSSLEALVRWNRPGHGRIAPDSFIPVAERSDLIVELDCWVIREVARQMAEWRDHPTLAGVPVSVNVSARHLGKSSVREDVIGPLRRARVPLENLIVEVTESAILEDIEGAARNLARIRRTGVRVAIDDFGTGYTSLTHLRALPVDILKVDRSFVANLADAADRSLVRLVIDAGHVLGLTVTTEGVERPDQAADLVSLGADHLQGFWFGRPAPASDVLADRDLRKHDEPAASSDGVSPGR